MRASRRASLTSQHSAWLEQVAYYAALYKTGTAPVISADRVFVTHRPHRAAAVASNDPLGRPERADLLLDRVFVTAFLRPNTNVASISIAVGPQGTSLPLRPGVSRVSAPFDQGIVSVTLRSADGKAISSTNSTVPIDDAIEVFDYDFNTFALSGSQASAPTASGPGWISASAHLRRR